MIIYILYYLVFKILSSFVRDSSYHNMYYKGCGLLCAHKKSFNTAIPVRSLGPYMYVHYCTYIVHILVSTYLFLLTSFFDCLSFCGLFLKHPYKRFFPFYILYFYQSRFLSFSPIPVSLSLSLSPIPVFLSIFFYRSLFSTLVSLSSFTLPSLSLFFSLSVVHSQRLSLSLSLSLSRTCLSFYLFSLSFSPSTTPVSLSLFLSYPCLSLSPAPIFLSISLEPRSLSLSFSHSWTLRICLSPTLSFFLSFSLVVYLFLSSIPVSRSLYLWFTLCGSLFFFSLSPPLMSFFLSFLCLCLSLSLSLSTTPVSSPIFLSPTLNLFLSFSLSFSRTPVSLSLSLSSVYCLYLSHILLSLCLSVSLSLSLCLCFCLSLSLSLCLSLSFPHLYPLSTTSVSLSLSHLSVSVPHLTN